MSAAAVAALIGCLMGAAQAPERIAEIRVHGNYTSPDGDIVALSGLSVDQDATEDRLRAAERRLRDTGRFEAVEVRRRYRSISDPAQILVVIVINEHPAATVRDPIPGPAKKIARAGMWLPLLYHEDGYGFTYGIRYSFVDPLGKRSRVSFPVTWGGERQAAVEAERLFDGPITMVRAGVSIERRVNPHFDVPDTRREGRVEANRTLTDWLLVGASARVANVSFGEEYEARHTGGGVHAVLDTRVDPTYPRNAVQARIGWERLAFGAGRSHRWSTDVRGYVGVVRSTVLALRAQFATSSNALPAAEQSLLGGGDSLRGYPTGHRAGDNLAALAVEVRQPVNSPLSIGRFGVKAFLDAGTVWNAGGRLKDQRLERGIGGGVYLGVGPLAVNLDLAWPESGSPRTHLGLGVSF